MAKKPKDLNELAKLWNNKLKKSGFNDIEMGGITLGKVDHRPFFTNELFRIRDKSGILHHNITDPSKFEKYRIIGVYAHNCETLDPLIAKILQHYANGLSIKKSIIAVGIYTYKGQILKLKTLEIIISNFLLTNMPKMIEFFNGLHNEDEQCLN